MPLDDGPVYEINGIVYYRASSLGGCARMLALARQGYEPLPATGDIVKVFAAGHEAERQAWVKGYVRGQAQEYVELVISDSIRVAGHLDSWVPMERVWEVKSQSQGEWRPIQESKLWYRYAMQISVYMHATGLPLTVVRVLRDGDGNVTNKADEVFDVAPVSMEAVRAKVFEVELLARRDLGEVKCGRVEYPCPFYYTHTERDGGEDGEGEGREQVGDPEAVVLARQYQNARIVAEAANGRVKASRMALLEYMGERTRLGLSDGTLLTRYKVAGKRVEYERGEYWALKVTTKRVEGIPSEGRRAG